MLPRLENLKWIKEQKYEVYFEDVVYYSSIKSVAFVCHLGFNI